MRSQKQQDKKENRQQTRKVGIRQSSRSFFHLTLGVRKGQSRELDSNSTCTIILLLSLRNVWKGDCFSKLKVWMKVSEQPPAPVPVANCMHCLGLAQNIFGWLPPFSMHYLWTDAFSFSHSHSRCLISHSSSINDLSIQFPDWLPGGPACRQAKQHFTCGVPDLVRRAKF